MSVIIVIVCIYINVIIIIIVIKRLLLSLSRKAHEPKSISVGPNYHSACAINHSTNTAYYYSSDSLTKTKSANCNCPAMKRIVDKENIAANRCLAIFAIKYDSVWNIYDNLAMCYRNYAIFVKLIFIDKPAYTAQITVICGNRNYR